MIERKRLSEINRDHHLIYAIGSYVMALLKQINIHLWINTTIKENYLKENKCSVESQNTLVMNPRGRLIIGERSPRSNNVNSSDSLISLTMFKQY